MKRNHKKLPFFFKLACILVVALNGCQKESIYHDYENTIKEYNGNAIEYLHAQVNTYDSLLLVLDRLPELKEMLTNQEVTFFAPTNDSFATAIKNLNIERLQDDPNQPKMWLSDCDPAELEILLSRYIILGKRTTNEFMAFSDGETLQTVKYNYEMHAQYVKQNASGFVKGGPPTIVFSDKKNSLFTKYWERTTTYAVNIKTTNAIINVLAPLHDFGFNEFVSRVNK